MVTAALSAIGGAFSGQTRREAPARPIVDSALPAIAAAKDLRTARLIQRAAREERLYNLISQPEVVGIAMVIGGIIAANYLPLSPDPEADALLKGVATTACVTMGLGYAGTGDLTSLSVGLAAGGATLIGEIIDESTSSFFSKLNPLNWKWPLGPIWNQ